MPSTPFVLLNLKETILVVTVLYFYALAFALSFDRPTYGMDAPAIFLTMSVLFLLAMALEIVLAWWDKRRVLLWFVLAVVSYGVIGLYVAPAVYGSWILLFVLLEPLLIAFVGGFAFASAHLIARSLFSTILLRPNQLAVALDRLPGWNLDGEAIRKTYEFVDFAEALNFVNQAGRVIEATHHHPSELHLTGNRVEIALTSPEERGVTITDVSLARKFDSL